MKRVSAPRSRVITLIVLATLVVIGIVAVTASAATRHSAAAPTPTCSLASIAGAWGHSYDGWNTNGVLTPFSAAGRTVVDSQGNVTGTETTSPNFLGGAFTGTTVTITGTVTINPDCTGTLTETSFDQSSNAVIRREVWSVVYVDNQTAMRATLFSLGSGPNNFIDSNVSATLNADKLFPPTGQ
jgi:hypothetical protein